MNTYHKFWQILFLATLFSWSCNKKETFGDGWAENVPFSVILGESQIYINGELVDFEPNFRKTPVILASPSISCDFLHETGSIDDVIHIRVQPIDVGPNDKNIDFDRFKENEEGNFESYEQVGKDTAFVEITGIDTVKMEIQGRFQVNFKKTHSKKVTNKARYPEKLLIQGVFNEKYFVF